MKSKAVFSPPGLILISSLSSRSRRLGPDGGAGLWTVVPAAGGRGTDFTRPSGIQPTLLSASHNPQGGDDLVNVVLTISPKAMCACACACVRVCVCVGRRDATALYL